MDALDRRLLDEAQAAVPLVPRPFRALGDRLGVPESEVLAHLEGLSREGVLRQIGGIFDTARLGYRSTLVAAVVPPERLEAAARVINAHPGVSHNYERDFAWNLWFTLAVPPESRLGLEATAARLAARGGCERHRLLPALRVFKIGVRLDMSEGGPRADRDEEGAGAPSPQPAAALDPADREVVGALQEPLALVCEPFEVPAARVGLSVAELLDRARALVASGALRRFAALLHHRRAGFTANAMGVWAVPVERIPDIASRVARVRAVSHCYERPTYPDWPYSVFSMVHARSREECLDVLEAIARETGIGEWAALWTRREWKKARLRYFTPEYEAWERAA